jgi:hypothetical protein
MQNIIGGGHLKHVPSERRLIKTVVLWIIVLLVVLPAWPARPASAAKLCASGKCVLACDTRLRQCSMYSLQEITPRLIVVNYMPYGYTRVYSNSVCERKVCARRSSACYLIP